mgnify:CR=1 FL=1
MNLVQRQLEEYKRQRDKLICIPFDRLDYDAIEKFLLRTSGWRAPSRQVLVAAVHKARTALITLDMTERTLSKRYLRTIGSEPQDDGDVPE